MAANNDIWNECMVSEPNENYLKRKKCGLEIEVPISSRSLACIEDARFLNYCVPQHASYARYSSVDPHTRQS